MTRMFKDVTAKINPLKGQCPHKCSYCWVEEFKKKFQKLKETYSNELRFAVEELAKFNRYTSEDVVFIQDMGDLFAEAVSSAWIKQTIQAAQHSEAKRLWCTKNPARFKEFLLEFDKEKDLLRTTIETDLEYIELNPSYFKLYHNISKAPLPSERLKTMKKLDYPLKSASVEPVMQFSNDFAKKLIECNFKEIHVGYDNHKKKLPEPLLAETKKLISDLQSAGITVHEKTIRRAWWEA